MTAKEKATEQARKELLEMYIKPEDTLLIVIKSVSASGMSRRMRVLTSDFSEISYLVGQLLDIPMSDKGLKIDGCGMDMTFWLADAITFGLYGKEKPAGLKGNGGGSLAWKTI